MSDHPSRKVRIAEFKARLSQYLRAVRRGHALTLLDRETPVARVLPWERPAPRLRVRMPIRPLREVALPPPGPRGVDSLAVLLEERQTDR